MELVTHKSAENTSLNVWKEGHIPIEHAIRGFYSVTLSEEGYEGTASKELGFKFVGQDGSRFRYQASNPYATTPTTRMTAKDDDGSNHGMGYHESNNIVDVLCLPPRLSIRIGRRRNSPSCSMANTYR